MKDEISFSGESQQFGTDGFMFKGRRGVEEINCVISRKALVRLANDSRASLDSTFAEYWWRIEPIARRLIAEGRVKNGRVDISEADIRD